MIYKFTILSDEVDNFARVIHIHPEATFLNLQDAILDTVNFAKNQLTSFFICNDNWEKGQEVTLIEMDTDSEYDNLTMEDTLLEELLTDEKQKLILVFDMLNERSFFIELSEIIPGKSVDEPVCILSKGQAPEQTLTEETLNIAPKITLDENFYGDEAYDMEELDEEGFGDLNFDDSTLFADDNKLS